MFDDLHERCVECVGLMVADGLSGLDGVIGEKFLGPAFQRCKTHLKRNMLARVCYGDKKQLVEDMRETFCTGDRNYTVEMGIQACKEMCLRWGKSRVSIYFRLENGLTI